MAGWLLPGCCARAHGRRRPSGLFVACGRRLCRMGRVCRPSVGLLTGDGRLLSDFPTLGMPPCRRCRMVLQHGPFQGAKRAVPKCGTALFARLFGPAAQVAGAQMVGSGAQRVGPKVKKCYSVCAVARCLRFCSPATVKPASMSAACSGGNTEPPSIDIIRPAPPIFTLSPRPRRAMP